MPLPVAPAEGNVDPTLDIYAFGILMYELATARPVYPALPSECCRCRGTSAAGASRACRQAEPGAAWMPVVGGLVS